MTDMTPKGVTQRLRLMDELWVLSVKLMNSKVIARHAAPSRKDRAREVQDSIRKVLFYDWDPIGISDGGGIDSEYDLYIAPIYRLLVDNGSEDDLVKRLVGFERDSMGLPGRDPETLRPVARKLLDLKVR
jgi:hypothetical protein